MEASELRIGNFLNPKVNGHILNDEIHIVEPTTLMCILNLVDSKGIEFVPILLTEEWLLKFGFSKSVRPNCEEIYKDLTVRMVLWFNEGNYAEMDIVQDGKHISFKHSHIKYVHQLQNIYFALTNEELQFTS